MFGLGEQATYLRCEYLFKAGEPPLPLVEAYRRGLCEGGLVFSYFKGNDSLLHYTLVDWSSGARRMVDVHGRVRSLWHKRKHPGEWLYAAFRADFDLDGPPATRGRKLDESSDRLELAEVGVRLAYNGRAFMGCETMSLVATCHATGVVTETRPEACSHNLDLLLGAFRGSWCETRPMFGWIGIGTRPDVDVPPLVGSNRVPRAAWFAFYPPAMVQEIRQTVRRSRGSYETTQLEDGSVMLENLGRRPRDLVYASPSAQDRSCP